MLTERSLSQELSRLEGIESPHLPILSVYLDLRPGVMEMRTIAPRLRDLIDPIRSSVSELDHAAAESLKAALDHVLGMEPRLAASLGHGVAMFVCPAIGLDEHIVTRRRVWDRAIAGPRPYLRPLRAVLDSGCAIATVIVDARNVTIMVTESGEVASYEVIPGEVVRKSNYAGWFALEETKSRRGAENARHRLFRDSAERLSILKRDARLDAIYVGGRSRIVAEFIPFLGPREQMLVAGTFSADVHTMGNSDIRAKAMELSAEWDQERHEALALRISEESAAGRLAVTGLPATLAAANAHAVGQLLVTGPAGKAGFRCRDCDSLALHGPVCATCGGFGDEVADVVEELITAVIDDGGRVAQGSNSSALEGQLVGAALRYRPN